MSELIIGDIIVESVFKKLTELFPTVAIFSEVFITDSFPNFFIFVVSLNATPDNGNYYYFDYLVNLRYRVASRPEVVADLQRQLDNVAMEVMSNIQYVDYNGVKLRVTDFRSEKPDNVLQMFFNIKIRGKKQLDEIEKQWTLTQNIELRSE